MLKLKVIIKLHFVNLHNFVILLFSLEKYLILIFVGQYCNKYCPDKF